MSKTAAAPIERIKLLVQNQVRSAQHHNWTWRERYVTTLAAGQADRLGYVRATHRRRLTLTRCATMMVWQKLMLML